MDRLAHEIKLRIIEEILLDKESTPLTKRNSLKALRQCCRAWSEVTLPYYFSRLHFRLWGDAGLRRLYRISRAPVIARCLEEITFDINFNIADPHPAPFSRNNQRRASSGFWQQQDEPPPSESRFKKLLATPLKKARRKSSIATAKSRLSVSSAPVDINDLFSQFDTSSRDTIANNLGRKKYAPTTGLPPLLVQISDILSSIFSSLPNLKRLCLVTHSQSDFIRSFTHGHALQFSPVFGTFCSISDLVTTTILRGWVLSSLFLSDLEIEAGSPFSIARFLQEVSPRDDSKEIMATAPADPIKRSVLEAKLSKLSSLSILYDEGFNHHSDQDINLRIARRSFDWTHSVADILRMTTNLKKLKLGRKGEIRIGNPPALFRLGTSHFAGSLDNNSTPAFPFHLSSLHITGFSATCTSLTTLLSAFNSTGTLKHLVLGPMRLGPSLTPEPMPTPPTPSPNTNLWISIFTFLRTNLRLKSFRFCGGHFSEPTGFWAFQDYHKPVFDLIDECSAETTPAARNDSVVWGGAQTRLCEWILHKSEYLFNESEEGEEDVSEGKVWREELKGQSMYWVWKEGSGEDGG